MVGALDPDGWLVLIDQSALEEMPWSRDLLEIIGRYSTNQDFAPYSLLDELTERGLFIPRGRKTTWPVPFSQTIEDYIDSIHGRNGFSRDRMTASDAAVFDRQVRDLLLSHHPDGIIRGRNQAGIHWGKPRWT